MLRGGSGDFLHSVTATLSGQHGTANVVCVRVVPNEDRVLTGAGRRSHNRCRATHGAACAGKLARHKHGAHIVRPCFQKLGCLGLCE